MWNKIKFDAVITIVLFGFGGLVNVIDHSVGSFFGLSAIAYGFATVGLPLFGFNVPSPRDWSIDRALPGLNS